MGFYGALEGEEEEESCCGWRGGIGGRRGEGVGVEIDWDSISGTTEITLAITHNRSSLLRDLVAVRKTSNFAEGSL